MSIKSLDTTKISNLNCDAIDCLDIESVSISADSLTVNDKKVSGDDGNWVSLSYTITGATFVGDIGGLNPVHYHLTDDDVRINGSLEVKTLANEFTISFLFDNMNNGSVPFGMGSAWRSAGTLANDKLYILTKTENISNQTIKLTYRTYDGNANTVNENRTVVFDIVYKYLLE